MALAALESTREQFPILKETIRGKRLVYLDNAASTQKPDVVIDTISDYYRHSHANVHRGVHALSQRATDQFEHARRLLQGFINAREDAEVVFTKGSTEAINLVAASWGRTFLQPGDRIMLTEMEHHANIVPWQVVAQQTGAEIIVVPILDDGSLDMEAMAKLLDERVKMVGVTHVSNVLGTVNPILEITQMAHAVGAKVLVDGAQALGHLRMDVQAAGVDFYTMASHKMYGPTGIGALYGRRELLDAMPPYQLGGGMIRSVTFEKTTYAALPDKFEPGTPNIADAIGLGAAIEFLSPRLEDAHHLESELTLYTHERLSEIPGLKIHGTAPGKAGTISFTMADVHPHDIGTILDSEGVAVRAGHHCCQPLMARLGVAATARASLALYNTREDIDVLASALRRVREVFGL
ncbi:MAG: cysteine desulfurase [Methanoregulaceae archaeon]|nr:cysteine desulfurase [Methanoregulaceae archaeon]